MHLMTMLAYDAVLVLLQLAESAAWLLELYKEHAPGRCEEDAVRHSGATW